MTAEITGAGTEFEDAARELESRLRGRLIRPTDGDYNEARLCGTEWWTSTRRS